MKNTPKHLILLAAALACGTLAAQPPPGFGRGQRPGPRAGFFRDQPPEPGQDIEPGQDEAPPAPQGDQDFRPQGPGPQGFGSQGFNRPGPQGFGQQWFSRPDPGPQGFGQQWFSRPGPGRQGFGSQGFNRPGRGRQGFGPQGFRQQGPGRGPAACLAEAGATPEQLATLRDLGTDNRLAAVDLRANVEKAQIKLDRLIDDPSADDADIFAAADSLSAARAACFRQQLAARLKARRPQQPPQQ